MEAAISKIKVGLVGLSEIMFDRFFDYSKEQRPPEQKLYYDGKAIVLPQANIEAFLFGLDPKGCAMTFEGKKCKEYRTIGMSHVFIEESIIPFMADGEPIIFDGFDGKQFWIHEGSPRGGSGSSRVKQEMKKRPVLKLPWALNFTLTLIKNGIINETKLSNWFTLGGMQIALGTYRPRWGRFAVETWEVVGEEKKKR
jgi:hypothetical protein